MSCKKITVIVKNQNKTGNNVGWHLSTVRVDHDKKDDDKRFLWRFITAVSFAPGLN